MQWSEIFSLANTFQEIQRSQSTTNLTKSNWIDIIENLQKKKYIQLIFSECGQYMMTPEYVKDYIYEQIEKQNGFVDLAKISKLLNVFLKDIQNIINFILRENDEIHQIEDKLYTNKFYEELAIKIQSTLREKLCLKLYELSLEFDIPYKVVKKVILEGIETVIDGTLNENGDVLYTNGALTRCKAVIKGITTGTLKIISLADLKERVQKIDPAFKDIFDMVIHSNDFFGRIVKSFDNFPSSFMPSHYERELVHHVNTAVISDGLINYQFYRNCGIRDVLKFVKAITDEPLHHLGTCCITAAKCENLISLIFSVLNKKKYVDLLTILPDEFEEADVRAFIGLLDFTAAEFSCRIENERWITTEEYMKCIFDRLRAEMEQYALNHLTEFKAHQNNNDNNAGKQTSNKRENKTKKKKVPTATLR